MQCMIVESSGVLRQTNRMILLDDRAMLNCGFPSWGSSGLRECAMIHVTKFNFRKHLSEMTGIKPKQLLII